MKRLLSLLLGGVVVVSLLIVVASNQISGAAERNSTPACNSRSLAGTYGFSCQGVAEPPGTGPREGFLPISQVGVETFDRNGGITQSYTLQEFDEQGNTTATLVSAVGAYTVNPDCTFTFVVTTDSGAELTYAGVLTDDYKKVRHIPTRTTTNAGQSINVSGVCTGERLVPGKR